MTNRTYGYSRVSTSKQTIEQQNDSLMKAGVKAEHVFSDVTSGTKFDRTGLNELRKVLREGDTLVIVALDRLGRSLSEMVQLLDELGKLGVILQSLREGIDFSTPTGKMMAGIFMSMGEYERELMLERQAAAREAAAARGRQVGRPVSYDKKKVEAARVLMDNGTSLRAAAAHFDMSPATLSRAPKALVEA
jgi:DNA invertase Pin-like site-specific DNA recombinase